jgi:tetratricopeptide (TPR) repeat protein
MEQEDFSDIKIDIKKLQTSPLYNLFYDALYHFNMGGDENSKIAYLMFREIATREETYKAEEDNPHYYMGYLAQYYFKDLRLAIEHYDKALEFHPNDVGSLQYRGICWLELGNYSKALFDLNKAVELDDGSFGLLDEIQDILQEAKNKAAAKISE